MGTTRTTQPGGIGTFTGNGFAYAGARMQFEYLSTTTSWAWSLVSKPAGSSAALVVRGAIAYLSPDLQGDYLVRFTDNASATTDVTITVEPAPTQRTPVLASAVSVLDLVTVDITGTADCSIAVQEAYDLLVGTGRSLLFPPGTYRFIAAGIQFRGGKAVPLILSPGTTFVAQLSTSVANQTGFLFYATATQPASVTTLSTAVTIGAQTITVASAAALAVGQKIFIRSTDGASGAQYYIAVVAGATITVDRPITRTFPSASTVQIIPDATEELQIIGNGALITGTCYRYVELVLVYRGHIEGLNFDDSQGFATVGCAIFDTGSYKCDFERCNIKGTAGFAFEAVDEASVVRCTAQASGTLPTNATGIYLSDCSAWRVSGSVAGGWTSSGSAGINLTSQGLLGCVDGTASDSVFPANATGINIAGGARVKLSNVAANNCTAGIVISSTVGVSANNIELINCATAASVQTATLVAFADIDITGFTIGIDCLSDVSINRLQYTGSASGAGIGVRATGCTVSVDGFDCTLSGTTPSTPNMFFVGAAGLMRLAHGRLHLSATAGSGQVAFNSSSSTGKFIDIDDVDIDASGTNPYLWNGAANTPIRYRLLRYPAATLSAGAPPFNGALTNRGTAVLVAGTKVVSWPDLQTADFVRVQLKTAGGVLGNLSVAMTPGTGFTVNSSNAADTSTVEWEVV